MFKGNLWLDLLRFLPMLLYFGLCSSGLRAIVERRLGERRTVLLWSVLLVVTAVVLYLTPGPMDSLEKLLMLLLFASAAVSLFRDAFPDSTSLTFLHRVSTVLFMGLSVLWIRHTVAREGVEAIITPGPMRWVQIPILALFSLIVICFLGIQTALAFSKLNSWRKWRRAVKETLRKNEEYRRGLELKVSFPSVRAGWH